MPTPRKIFRIEETDALRRAPLTDDNDGSLRHGEIMRELTALRTAFAAALLPSRGHADRGLARLPMAELAQIGRELEAVLKGSEEATQKILAAAEDIDQAANNLSAALKNDSERGLAQDMRDRVVEVFEACNFQDLNSQRVAKIMATLNRIENEVARALAELDAANAAPAMHGPRLDGDGGHVSQGEIDAMFS
jgi:hypothetical protein